MAETNAFLFGPVERRLFGVFHPARQPMRASALMCPPLLHEHARSYRFFMGVAELLAEAGVACLRFDYYGTGDSAGNTDEFHPGRAGEDIALAATALDERAPGVPRILIGIRGSALIARAHAAAIGAAALWLWQPVPDASGYLGELDALDAAERGSRFRYPFVSRGPAARADELAGFCLPATFRDEWLAIAERPVPASLKTVVVDTAPGSGSDVGVDARIALPEAATSWIGQVEMEGLIPSRATRKAIESLVATMAAT